MTFDRTRRPRDPLAAAEAVFAKASPKPAANPTAPTIPGAKELVSLRIDADVLAFFQADGPGWQERINDALKQFIVR